MTFRAKVHDRAQATAREVITYIEQWITSSVLVTIPVHHARTITHPVESEAKKDSTAREKNQEEEDNAYMNFEK